MGRKRIIDQEAILDAAERVVGHTGAANLTLDAVAKEAGVTKASVLYDHKTKQALIEAVIDRAFKRDKELHSALEEQFAGQPDRSIRSRIAAAGEPPNEEFRAVALHLSAALAIDEGLRGKMQNSQAATIDQILKTSKIPRGALLAYVALEGLKFLELLDFHHFPPAERQRLLQEISWLVTTEPEVFNMPAPPAH